MASKVTLKEAKSNSKNAKDQPPPNEEKDQPPSKEAKDQPPSKEAKDQPPSKEAKDQPPTKGAKDQPPTKGAKDQPPAKGAKNKAPSKKIFPRISTHEIFHALKTASESPAVQVVGVLLCLALLGIAIWTSSLYLNRRNKSFPVRSGMNKMKNYEDYKGESDLEMFDKVDRSLQELENLTKTNEELLNDILVVNKKFREGWKQGFTFLFYFSSDFHTWDGCFETCKNRNTSMITINTHELQSFLLQELKYRHANYWIALRRRDSIWAFVDGTEVGTQFWSADHQTSPGLDCAALKLPCGHHVNCWDGMKCDGLYRCICRESAKPKWLK